MRLTTWCCGGVVVITCCMLCCQGATPAGAPESKPGASTAVPAPSPGALGSAAGALAAAAPPSALDPRADELFKKCSTLLSSTKRFTFDAHAIRDDVLETGQRVQFARNSKMAVRRPDGAVASVVGDLEDMAFIYDGKTVTIHNRATNSYGSTPAAATIDATFDLLAEKYGMTLPLSDLLFSDPYAALIGRVRAGRHLGTGWVFDTKCHHLAFRQESVDWEIWIEDGPTPLPRKLVITYKESPGFPQYTAYLSNWNLSPSLPDDRFTFAPPAGAKKVEFVAPASTTTQPTGDAPSPKGP